MVLRLVVTNVIAQLIGKAFTAVAAFATTLIIAKVLGVELYGAYTQITAFIVLFYLLLDFGINTIFLQDLAKQPQAASPIERSFLGLRVFLGVLTAVLAIVSAFVLSWVHPGFTPVVTLGILIASPAVVAFAAILSLTAFFQHALRYKDVAISTIAGSVVTLGLTAFRLMMPGSDPYTNIYWFLLALVLGMITTLLIGTIRVRSVATLKLEYDKKIWLSLLQRSLPLGLVLIFNALYFRVDLLILGYYKSTAEIGSYGFAYKFFEFAIVLPTFVMNSVYPLLLQQDKAQRMRLLTKTIAVLFVASVGVSIFFWIGAGFIPWIGVDYKASVQLLRLLTLSLPIFYITSPLMWLFVIQKRQQQLIWVYAIALTFTILANLVFIPHYGAVASAIITGVSEAIVLGIGYFLFIRGGNYDNQ